MNDTRERDERFARWEALADNYSTDFRGKIEPTDTFEYAGAIASLLSDTQEEMARIIGDHYFDTRYNDRINAAKCMLFRMKDAARAAWSNA